MSTPDIVRWGIAGPGNIANSLAADFPHTPHAELVAVASRSAERARRFADEHGTARAYGSYRELIDDPDVDVIYVATPHPQHLAIAEAALRAGKGVLVEKSFTATLAGTQRLVEVARETGRFAMEAMWTRFQPAIAKARELVADGAIGRLGGVQADLCIGRSFEAGNRLFEPETGGGALLDLGVYPVSFAQHFLGDPDRVEAMGARYDNGADSSATVQLGYADGRLASLYCSIENAGPGRAMLLGSDGWIEVPPRFHHPDRVILHRKGAEPEEFVAPRTGAGYAHELIEVTEAVRAGRTESELMPLSDTVAVMAILQQAADQIGLEFAEATEIPT
ncbi:Gfo/Idh/MocA family protein [Naumannella cuiyingiana]|uniref:Putative dehydrogenase n=1 Tax=Naumannella cuiyingiana TaxID=1347891 RepID=A0A7Z0D9N9_9ACTN|nr:Gfo/Idh/MocA family oxidoreductase [Naumannella cuiyingiana]NYI71334.1 putative dehydrogenase [Naumannella cuiyingiana]